MKCVSNGSIGIYCWGNKGRLSSKAQQRTFFTQAFALKLQTTINNNQCLVRLPKFKWYLLVQVVMQSCQLFSSASQRMLATKKAKREAGSRVQLIWKWLNTLSHALDLWLARSLKFRGGDNKIRCSFGIECADPALLLAPYQEHKICALKTKEAVLWLDGMSSDTPMAYASLGINWKMCAKNLLHNYEISLSMQKYFAG